MSRPKRYPGSRIILTILVLATLTIITLDFRGYTSGVVGRAKSIAHDVVQPFQVGVTDMLRPVGSYLDSIFQTGSLIQENQQLRSENSFLRQKLLSTAYMREQLKQISTLEKLPYIGSIPIMTAPVIAGASSNFESTIELGKGASSGIALGMPVVGYSGLLGTVIDVWSSGCTVRLLSDPHSVIGVRVGVNGPYAMVAGTGNGGKLTVDYIAPGTQLQVDTPIYTSGLNGAIFPPGIPVGYVSKVNSTTNASGDESVQATMSARLSGFQYVDVLQWVQGSQ